uniref:RRM domain-containing protein n=1 Tax=Timema douglasi TaxID=61478 RepID=A0A7R8VQS5_TIMDO|nr:unnamed protein product [Timema douglasi]
MTSSIALNSASQASFAAATQKLTKSGAAPSLSVNERHKGRGVVYISRLPYGFFENELRKYFIQFGQVTQIYLRRSKKTGKSCGYAFVEFLSAEVAKVAASTMHNYLCCNRLLKRKTTPSSPDTRFEPRSPRPQQSSFNTTSELANYATEVAQYMPPEKFDHATFWKNKTTETNYPRLRNRRIDRRRKNRVKSANKVKTLVSKQKSHIKCLLKKLKEKGIDYNLEGFGEPPNETKPSLEDKVAGVSNTSEKAAAKSTHSLLLRENKPETAGKSSSGRRLSQVGETQVENEQQAVLEIDESDDEIEFKIPPNVILKRKVSLKNTKRPEERYGKVSVGKPRGSAKKKLVEKRTRQRPSKSIVK